MKRLLIALCCVLFSTPAMAAPLLYPAPKLVNPTTITLDKGATITKMDVNKDYIIKCPTSKKVGSTLLQGGHSYIVQGCHVTVPKGDAQQRAFYINGATGTVHIEGVLVDFSGGEQGDAFAISAPLADVQIQRTRVDGVLGSQSLFHGDIIQPWGGVKSLKVDTFTGSTYYQGFQFPAMDGKPLTGPVTISRTNLTSLGTSTKESGGFLIWLIKGTANCDTPIPASFSEVYLKQRADGHQVVWPPLSNHACISKQVGNLVSFPNQPGILGNLIIGSPPAGDFVPANQVGVNYRPGGAYWSPKAPTPVVTPTPTPVTPTPQPTPAPVWVCTGGGTDAKALTITCKLS